MLKNLFKRFKKKEGKPKMESSQLSDITRGLYHAASSTTAMVAQQYIHILQQFFDQMDDGTLQAKMAKVAVDDNHYIMVPLVSLVSPTGFNLDKMKVGLAVRIDGVDVEAATHPSDDSDATRSAFTVSISPRPGQGERLGEAMTIDMEFVSHAPPEGLMRIIDAYTNLIRPAKLIDGNYPPIHPVSLKEVAKVEREGEGSEAMPGDEPDGGGPAGSTSPAGDSGPSGGSAPDGSTVAADPAVSVPAPRRPEDGPGGLAARV